MPLFIELRKFNEITSEDFSAFLFRSVLGPKSKIRLEDFEGALSEGAFTLLLDGFDEINDERRSFVENEILRLSRNYPNLSIVISSRPDDRFDGWQAFSAFRVMPLDQKQVVDLMQKLKYDDKIKKKFIQRIKADLFRRHQSFLSSPLLATMMLLTFDQFADIPEKIHLFYDQAFDTLFAKHDATKEAYKRKSFTGLSIDVFKKTLAYFCLISYYSQRHEFSDAEVRTDIGKAVQMLGQPVNEDLFLRDLKEHVCTLQKEGLYWTFTHRSFQEYFAAYCLSNLIPNRMSDIFPHIVGRTQDNMLRMCFDMNQETLENEYITSNVKRIVKHFAGVKDADILTEYMNYFNCSVFASVTEFTDKFEVTNGRIIFHSEKHEWLFANAITVLYDLDVSRVGIASGSKNTELVKLIRSLGVGRGDFLELRRIEIADLKYNIDDSWIESSGISSAPNKINIDDLKKCKFDDGLIKQIKQIRTLSRNLDARRNRRGRSIDEIFELK